MKRLSDRGDTIIEVMFAVAVFSMVVVGAIMLMNRGVGMAQRSLEITQARQQIDAQISMARHLHVSDPARWNDLLTRLSVTVPPFTDTATCPEVGSPMLQGSFFFARAYDSAAAHKDGVSTGATVVGVYDINSSNFSQAVSYGAVDYTNATPRAYGLWAQIVRSEEMTAGQGTAYDLHVRACWGSTGSATPVTIGTVTRIYDGS